MRDETEFLKYIFKENKKKTEPLLNLQKEKEDATHSKPYHYISALNT